MKKILGFMGVLGILAFSLVDIACADLTKQDIEEIRKIVREEVGHVEKRLEEKIGGVEKRVNDLQVVMLWGFGIIFTGIFALIGFVLWDRRTTLAPTARKIEALEEKEKIIERILREYAQKEPELAAIMRNVAL